VDKAPFQLEVPSLPTWRSGTEVALVFLLFFLFAGGEPPGVNESHYLCKAKHYWSPDWCRDDQFLNSADAHTVFYWTFGWITKYVSLTTTAWIGRIIVWLLQAWAWQRLSWSVVPRPWFSLLSAGVFLACIRYGHMAGEWVIGDVEAKGIAYVFVFLGLDALVRARWHWVFPLLGVAAAFHVIVGGWAVVAAGMAWLILKYVSARPGLRTAEGDLPSLLSLLPSSALGLVFSLPGLLPCLLLDQGTPHEIVSQGTVAYVYVRLNHHLVISRFPADYVARHLCLVAVWAALAWIRRKDPALVRLNLFALGAVLLMVVGVAIDQGLLNASNELRARLLRFYWYRLSDSIVPVALSLMCCRFAAGLSQSASKQPVEPTVWQQWCTVALVTLATLCIVDVRLDRVRLDAPEAQRRLDETQLFSIAQRHRDWAVCCDWIMHRTDPYAIFITPRDQQTFKWYAQRAEVVTWKDCPQDARSIVEWLQRYEDVHPHPSGEAIMFGPQIDPELPVDERLRRLAEKYDAQYVVVDRAIGPQPRTLIQVYPTGEDFNPSFAVYAVTGSNGTKNVRRGAEALPQDADTDD